ncbi:hypothetical protein NST68_30645 [Paenibacillus sp. FSL E2-0230]|uniref:hypothetical protein n=1 Tax=Paenibacillus sp. FSL E2-0230 TaxID=2954727 RepID=UPI0030CD5E29
MDVASKYTKGMIEMNNNSLHKDIITPTEEEVKREQLIEVLASLIKKYAELKTLEK